MIDYRIILRGGMFIVQRKGWFGWRDVADGVHFDDGMARIHKQQLEGSDVSRPYRVVEF